MAHFHSRSLVTLVVVFLAAISHVAASSAPHTLHHLHHQAHQHSLFRRGNVTHSASNETLGKVASTSTYWLADPRLKHGQMPFAGNGYQVFRNVLDYGAKGDGVSDDTSAINLAVSDGGRCGAGCNATSTKGAIVYFPPGTYLISKPIVQYFYTQFVGDPLKRPVIKGTPDFSGIALIDTNVYGPGGVQWYIGTGNFYRHIRNFVIDLTAMPNYIETGAGQVANGIHWQVAQQATLQNIHFEMPISPDATHTGIFTENGGGSFLSDLTFHGGAVGWKVGNQQYTARNLVFKNVKRAIAMSFDWGFLWKSIHVENCDVAIDIADNGAGSQSTASLTVLDSTFTNVDRVININPGNDQLPEVVLDNVKLFGKTSVIVGVLGGATFLSGGEPVVQSWAMGKRFLHVGNGTDITGNLPANHKPSKLLDSAGKFVERTKPQYENVPFEHFLNVLDFGVTNGGTGDNTHAINKVLSLGAETSKIVFFPAGIYTVEDTVKIPVGSRIIGELWPQIMGVGEAFENKDDLNVVVQVGEEGDCGLVEISEMLFTTRGATAGAIVVEWNIREDKQASAAMWDSFVRIGGAAGTDLQLKDCPQPGADLAKCSAASMLFHMTQHSSAYLENLWFWTADHDIDDPLQTNLNIFSARSVLIESHGPTWIHSASSEHATLYQWQFSDARNVYLGHIQSETPYFQPNIPARQPYTPGQSFFPGDPGFTNCDNSGSSSSNCEMAWALRVIESKDVYMYGGGFYSFFNNYSNACSFLGNCQDRLVRLSRSSALWLYDLFTVGAQEIISPRRGPATPAPPNRKGFSTAISAWLAFSS